MRKIPLKEQNPRYGFVTTLDGNQYELAVHWNETAGVWFLDIAGVVSDVDVRGIGLVVGQNLLKPFALVDLGALYVVDLQREGTDPTFESMGVRHVLLYAELSESDAII